MLMNAVHLLGVPASRRVLFSSLALLSFEQPTASPLLLERVKAGEGVGEGVRACFYRVGEGVKGF
jgi:hypothetical protein